MTQNIAFSGLAMKFLLIYQLKHDKKELSHTWDMVLKSAMLGGHEILYSNSWLPEDESY